jgi:hypothetical protein
MRAEYRNQWLNAHICSVSARTIVLPHDGRVASATTVNINCVQSGPCLKVGNGSSGSAVLGSSTDGNGIVGRTFFNAASAAHGTSGVVGMDASTNVPYNACVSGFTTSGIGVVGQTAGKDVGNTGSVGVAGIAGGTGNFNIAVEALSTGGPAAMADSLSSYGLVATSHFGRAFAASSDQSIGVQASGTTAIEATSFPSTIANTNDIALDLRLVPSTQSGALNLLIRASVDKRGGTEVMSLDQDGNMILAGSLTQNGVPLSTMTASDGRRTQAYVPRQTSPTIDDMGEAQLHAGMARVTLSSAFAALIDRRRTYLVFLTPLGDCNGLYVTDRTPAGFTVHELRGGTSNVGFDYPVLATPTVSSRHPSTPPLRRARHASRHRLPTSPHEGSSRYLLCSYLPIAKGDDPR